MVYLIVLFEKVVTNAELLFDLEFLREDFALF